MKCYHNTKVLNYGLLLIILFITGRPISVDLYCSLFTVYSIQCNWSIPYTIGGIDITGYNINITDNEDNLINMTTVNENEYTYNASQFGVYNISVAAVIGDQLKSKINSAEMIALEGRNN